MKNNYLIKKLMNSKPQSVLKLQLFAKYAVTLPNKHFKTLSSVKY